MSWSPLSRVISPLHHHRRAAPSSLNHVVMPLSCDPCARSLSLRGHGGPSSGDPATAQGDLRLGGGAARDSFAASLHGEEEWAPAISVLVRRGQRSCHHQTARGGRSRGEGVGTGDLHLGGEGPEIAPPLDCTGRRRSGRQ
ncbi:hypothetical protein PR202_gb00112 [Eleusine coracana subsp. coracana]|uniref:Uncharacterized protein n=1 Tax=Eleusine coracana subsp. coracana TaxID=191504 RepID=A0AAV5DSN0_ELECO|nr:hypothetical protein PR202_gb00112 [Eleusine coracana subsp. coracana]